MITRVAIQGYKSLADVEVAFEPLTVIFGPNAAGKSNLFDALGLLSRMVTMPTLNQAFEQHRGSPLEAFHLGDGGLERLLNNPAATFTIEVDVLLGDDVVETVEHRIRQMREGLHDTEHDASRKRILERRLRYRLTVEILTQSGLLRVRDEELVALRQDGQRHGGRIAFVNKQETEPGRPERLVMRLEGQSQPISYDLGMDHTLVSMPLYAPHYPHLTAFKEEVGRWRFYYLDPERMRANTPLKEVETLNSNGSDLAAFYNTLRVRNPRQFDAIKQALHTLLPSVDGFEVRRDTQGFLQLYVIDNGIPFSARSISEGTLRLLGLLAIMCAPTSSSVIGYEEPENGVHPRRISLIADLLRNASSAGSSQLLVNTHSPLLPDHLADTYLLACRRKQRETVVEHYRPTGLFKSSEIADYLSADDEYLNMVGTPPA